MDRLSYNLDWYVKQQTLRELELQGIDPSNQSVPEESEVPMADESNNPQSVEEIADGFQSPAQEYQLESLDEAPPLMDLDEDS